MTLRALPADFISAQISEHFTPSIRVKITCRYMYVKKVLLTEGSTVATSTGKTITQVFLEAGIKVKHLFFSYTNS